jgi:hypothetical protein
MDEDSPTPEPEGKPSQVPSWLTLGFALGAVFVMALPKHPTEAPMDAAMPAPPALKAAAPARITTIEAVFADWGKYAQWSGATTQVGLWNPETKSYSDFYEVVRMGDVLFFRSIPALTAPVVSGGIPQECPLEFAQASRNQAPDAERTDMNAISESIRETFAPTVLPKTAPSK